MRSHSTKACWYQRKTPRSEPFSSSRQTTPVQDAHYQMEPSKFGRPKEIIKQHPTQHDYQTADTEEKERANIKDNRMNCFVTNQELRIPEKYQVVSRGNIAEGGIEKQNETRERRSGNNEQLAPTGENMRIPERIVQIKDTEKKTFHDRGREIQYKEPFFVNHYYSHPIGQCCCQQQGIAINRSAEPIAERSENSHRSQPLQRLEICPVYRNASGPGEIKQQQYTTRESAQFNPIQEEQVANEERIRLVEAKKMTGDNIEGYLPRYTQLHQTRQLNTTAPISTDVTVPPPPICMKKEQVEQGPNTSPKKSNEEAMNERGELLKAIHTVAQSLQQQIVLSSRTADINRQHSDALMGELIKAQNRRDMDHVFNNIPTFSGLHPEKCVDWATPKCNKPTHSESSMDQHTLCIQIRCHISRRCYEESRGMLFKRSLCKSRVGEEQGE